MLNNNKKKCLLKVSKVFKDGGRGKKGIFRRESEEKANNLGTWAKGTFETSDRTL